MGVEIRDSTFLKLKLSRTDNERQPVSFLVGAPFSFDEGRGVPNVDGFLDVIRHRVAQSGQQFSTRLDQALASTSGPLRYQSAMGFVYDALDAQAAANIVGAAVLRARKPGLPDFDPSTSYDGSPEEWEITRAQRGLARVMNLDPDRFSGPIFTTNFDPLIELALREQGFIAKTTNIPLDGSIAASVKASKTEADVFHLHGFWRNSSTLHRPQQLLTPRPQLQQSLQRYLDNTHLVVMAYSGWDDIFTTAIANCLNDPGFRGTLSWCFYGADPTIIEAENQALLSKFAAGIAQGKISFFCGIDCHSFFDDLIGSPGWSATRMAVAASPMPGWQIVTSDSLASAPSLSGLEAIRFFDGAVPTLRHAISPLIPRLSYAELLTERLTTGVVGGCGMQLLRAAGGEGKSTALLQVAALAAQGDQWTVLYRPGTDATLNPDVIAGLDPDRQWLIVADDAEGLIEGLWQTVDRLHAAGRHNVFLLLAARDTDWRAKDGDRKAWATRITKLNDVVMGDIVSADAMRVVEAWTAQGDTGLRALKHLATVEERAAALANAARTSGQRGDEGSFFGGLLQTRFGATGLVDHLLPLLELLKERRVEGSQTSLFDALLYIANCHATGMVGLEHKILARLCGIPVFRVSSAVVVPLGRELGTAESRGHVLTRHRRVAESIVVAAARTGVDLGEVWHHIVMAAAAISRNAPKEDQVGETYSSIVHSGSRLHRDLPAALGDRLRGDVGIVAAEAAHEAIPEWSSVTAALARALRSRADPQAGADLMQRNFAKLTQNTVDWKKNIRGYLCEWATCQSQIGGRQARLANAWLDSLSLCDRLPVDIERKQVAQSCTGLMHAYDNLWDGDPNGNFAKGHSAALTLGARAPDAHLSELLLIHRSKLAQRGVPAPIDDDQIYAWLREGAVAAWSELEDNRTRLQPDGVLAFTNYGSF